MRLEHLVGVSGGPWSEQASRLALVVLSRWTRGERLGKRASDALLGGRPLARPAARLTRLAEPSAATVHLHVGEGHSLRTRLEWSEPTPTATLARQVALELGEIDPKRLKRCALPACDLLFYDTTRSGTRRWHAESPCGARERQRRHRAAASTSSPTERG